MNSTGQYYYNARWYDPNLGRFTTEDPIRDGLNWYIYANNNPLRFVDPTGLQSTAELDYRDYGLAETDYSVKESPDYYTGELYDLKSDLESLGESLIDSMNSIGGVIGTGPLVRASQFEAAGLSSEESVELAEACNDGYAKGTVIGAGGALSLYAGTTASWLVSVLAAGSSTHIAGGDSEDIINSIAATSILASVPTGSSVMSTYYEGAKAGIASILSQQATSGDVNWGVAAAYTSLGFFSQLSVLGGAAMADFELTTLGEYFLPISGSIIIEKAAEND